MPQKDNDKRVRVKVVEESEEDRSKSDEHNHDEHEEEKDEHLDHEKHDKIDDDDDHDEHEEHEHKSHEGHDDEKDSQKPLPTNYPRPEKIPFWILFFSFLIGLTLGAGLIGGIFYYRSKVAKLTVPNQVNEEAVVQEATEPTATPLSEEELDLSKYSIQILNGAGFSDTETGNAGVYDYQETEIALKPGLPDSLYEEIKDALESYKVKKVEDLEASSSYDVVITVGQSKN
jgi:hypothetical protein